MKVPEWHHWKTPIEAIGEGLSCDAIYYVVQRRSNFWVFGFWICEVIQLNKGSWTVISVALFLIRHKTPIGLLLYSLIKCDDANKSCWAVPSCRDSGYDTTYGGSHFCFNLDNIRKVCENKNEKISSPNEHERTPTFRNALTCSFLFIRHLEAATLFRSRRSFRLCSSSGVSCISGKKKSRTNICSRTTKYNAQGIQSQIRDYKIT